MKKTILRILGIFVIILIIAFLVNLESIKKLQHVMSLFDEDNIVENFLNMKEDFPVSEIEKSDQPTQLPVNKVYNIPENFVFEDSMISTKDYMEYVRTTGILVIHRDTIVHESYYNGLTESTTHISWSVAKSFVSCLVGIAMEEGLISSVEDPIDGYLPRLATSAYSAVSIKDILQMSSGVKFVEDYRDFNSDINKFGRYFALGKSFEDFVLSMKTEKKPGTYNHYVSLNTQVLGMLVAEVTGKPLSEYLKEKIWDPLGMEYGAEWITDNTGMEMALGGLNVTLRDYGKYGLLFQHQGNWNGEQLIPRSWIEASIATDEPHLVPGKNELSNSHFGYGYQWWIPEAPTGDFFAAGIYNQYIYISPDRSLVIVKLSANHHFKEENDNSKDMHIAMLQTIANDFTPESTVIEVGEEELAEDQ